MLLRTWLQKDRMVIYGVIGAIFNAGSLIMWSIFMLCLVGFLLGISTESTLRISTKVFYAPTYAFLRLGFPVLAEISGKFILFGIPVLGALLGYCSIRIARKRHQEIPRVSIFALHTGIILFGLMMLEVIGNFLD